jgi:hypothetical protein
MFLQSLYPCAKIQECLTPKDMKSDLCTDSTSNMDVTLVLLLITRNKFLTYGMYFFILACGFWRWLLDL